MDLVMDLDEEPYKFQGSNMSVAFRSQHFKTARENVCTFMVEDN